MRGENLDWQQLTFELNFEEVGICSHRDVVYRQVCDDGSVEGLRRNRHVGGCEVGYRNIDREVVGEHGIESDDAYAAGSCLTDCGGVRDVVTDGYAGIGECGSVVEGNSSWIGQRVPVRISEYLLQPWGRPRQKRKVKMMS